MAQYSFFGPVVSTFLLPSYRYVSDEALTFLGVYKIEIDKERSNTKRYRQQLSLVCFSTLKQGPKAH